MIDCHVHTARCGHADGDAAAYVAAARQAGLAVLCFTEHLPLPDDLDPDRQYSMPTGELGAYVAEIESLKRMAGETGTDSSGTGLTLLIGAEADWLPNRMTPVESLLASQPFDVVLGSVHFIDGWAFDDPSLVSEWDSADVDIVWTAYFSHVSDAARSGLFDVMAHPDLVKKFGHRPAFDTRDLYEATAHVFATAGVAIEVSTAGLRKPVGELYPAQDFLRACRRCGVPATMGSDAHSPAEVGFRMEAAREALVAAGYESVVYFEKRQPREVAL
jgi:histidinol-phosphatase (PHP family)